MTKQPLAFLFLCLLAALLVATGPSPVLSVTEGPGQADALPTDYPPVANPPTYQAITFPCNRPASDMPLRPDGCLGNEFPVGPPPEPIPPPCIAAWSVEEWDEDGQPVTELLITVEHPELQRYAPRGWVHLASHGDAWQLVTVDVQVSCGKDEAPLAWATLQVLNGGDIAAVLEAYTRPLPSGYFTAITALAQWRKAYLPTVARRYP